ncbi:MAG TPA: CYTH domain-containing protein [Gammaproteobacteria bacterium]|nr:CYTH domain-containing protein [Gammaproteobacteria bacterium]
MPREIERKFLLQNDDWRALAQRRVRMSQGYLASGGRVSVRIRIAGDVAHLNMKAGGLVASRAEYEYPVPVADARELLALADGPLIDKTRHFVEHGGFEWEVDEFHGDNSGLIVAELELAREDEPFPRPPWLAKEVTQLERYYNVRLVKHPYRAWTEAERSA